MITPPIIAQWTRRKLLRRLMYGIAFTTISGSLMVATGCQQEPEVSTDSPASVAPAPGASVEVGASPKSTGAFPTKPEGAFKIGLITPGSTQSDTAWSKPAYDGVQKIAAETGATVTPPIESPAAAEVEGALRNLAQDGNQLIFLHGSEYDAAATAVAPSFPNTTFVVTGGRTEAPNLTPVRFEAAGATFLAGMVAGTMTKTGKIACVGASEIPIVRTAFENFTAGAKAVSPKVEVRVVFTGDEKDIAKAKQQTEALLADGVDVVQHNANDAGRGVAQAIEGKPGTFFMGANSDQSDLATKQNIGSFILDVPNAFLAVGRRVAAGEGDGKAVSAGLAQHAVYFQFNPRFAGTVPKFLKDKLVAAERDIIAGKVPLKK